MYFSLIAPTFGRPEEVTEFLESLLHLDSDNFEVIIGDGTPRDTLRPELKRFEENGKYKLKIVYEEYLPVSDARNQAAKLAKGDYFIFLDSDCIIPVDYLKKVENHLKSNPLDAFGGPDVAHKNFTTLQKAISYSMTSIFTTGGIRGGSKTVGQYHPRGFNMGIRRKVFEAVNGYSEFRCGEDIELSMRIIKAGFTVSFIPEAYVYHKRRTNLKQFFRQVYRFGAARINIWKRHPEELKLTHFFPLGFSVFLISSIIGTLFGFPFLAAGLGLSLFYLFLILVHSFLLNGSFKVALSSVITSVTMLLGYGWGFAKNWWAYAVLGKEGGLKL